MFVWHGCCPGLKDSAAQGEVKGGVILLQGMPVGHGPGAQCAHAQSPPDDAEEAKSHSCIQHAGGGGALLLMPLRSRRRRPHVCTCTDQGNGIGSRHRLRLGVTSPHTGAGERNVQGSRSLGIGSGEVGPRLAAGGQGWVVQDGSHDRVHCVSSRNGYGVVLHRAICGFGIRGGLGASFPPASTLPLAALAGWGGGLDAPRHSQHEGCVPRGMVPLQGRCSSC